VFREFEHYVDRREDRLEEIMEQLLGDARYFRDSETVESGARGREALFHERRLAMGTGAVWPLLLKLRHLDVDTDDREACFVALALPRAQADGRVTAMKCRLLHPRIPGRLGCLRGEASA
jgi:hypothetical protein